MQNAPDDDGGPPGVSQEVVEAVKDLIDYPYEIDTFMSLTTMNVIEDALKGLKSLPVLPLAEIRDTSTGALTEDVYGDKSMFPASSIPPPCLFTGACVHDEEAQMYRYPREAKLGDCEICYHITLSASGRALTSSTGSVLTMPKQITEGGSRDVSDIKKMVCEIDRSIFSKKRADIFAAHGRLLEIAICGCAHLAGLAFFCLPCGHYHNGCTPTLSLMPDDLISAARKICALAAQNADGRGSGSDQERACFCAEFHPSLEGAPREGSTVYVVSARVLSARPGLVLETGLPSPSDRVRAERPVALSAAEYLLSIARATNYAGMEPLAAAAAAWKEIKFQHEVGKAPKTPKPHKRGKRRPRISCDVRTPVSQAQLAYQRVLAEAMGQKYVCAVHEVEFNLERVLQSMTKAPMYFHPQGIAYARHTRAAEATAAAAADAAEAAAEEATARPTQ